MIASANKSKEIEPASWQERFLELLPTIEQHARFAFRHLDAESQEDAIAEIVASTACAYERLFQRGEQARAFATVLARYAVAQFWDGRRVGTSQCSRDVFSLRAKQDGDYELLSIGAPGEKVGEWRECLVDNRRTRVPDQAAFRIDFPAWLESQSPRDKQIAEKLSLNYSTGEVAREFKISMARISQLRRELADSWYAFLSCRNSAPHEAAEADDL